MAENVSALADVNHDPHHKEHRVLGEDGTGSANLTPADESALDDANSLVVSALGESDLSSVYQLQSTTATAVSSSVENVENTPVTSAETDQTGSACESTTSSTLSSIPVAEACSAYTDAAATPADCQSDTANLASSTLAADSTHTQDGVVESLGVAVEETGSKRIAAETASEHQGGQSHPLDGTANIGADVPLPTMVTDESGVEIGQSDMDSSRERKQPDDANGPEMANTTAAMLTTPILDSAPAVEQPSTGTAADLTSQPGLSSAASAASSANTTTMVSGLKKVRETEGFICSLPLH